MNTLTANIQREWLARIIDGSKTIEYRDATEFWCNKLERVWPPPFQLRLINGMRADSPEATVLIDKVEVDILAGQLRFHIAKVLSTTRWDQSWHAKYPPLPPEAPFDPNTVLEQKLPLIKVTIRVPQDPFDRMQSPGVNQFSIEADDKLANRILAEASNPFRIRLSAGGSTHEVVVFELLSEPFTDSFSFSILSPPVLIPPATA